MGALEHWLCNLISQELLGKHIDSWQNSGAIRYGKPAQSIFMYRHQTWDVPGVAQNAKPPQARKYEKNAENLQNPPFRVGPRKYRKISTNYENAFVRISGLRGFRIL